MVWSSLSVSFFLLYLCVINISRADNITNACISAFGLENDLIKDNQLSASSHVEYMHITGKGTVHTEPKYGRLNNNYAWCGMNPTRWYHKDPYFQVDFKEIVNISGLATQGLKSFYPYYVQTYSVRFSVDGAHWLNYSSPNNEIWRGNTDANTIRRVVFGKLIQARYLRIYPLTYRYRVCLRVEVYGCYLNQKDNGTQVYTISTTQPSTPSPINAGTMLSTQPRITPIIKPSRIMTVTPKNSISSSPPESIIVLHQTPGGHEKSDAGRSVAQFVTKEKILIQATVSTHKYEYSSRPEHVFKSPWRLSTSVKIPEVISSVSTSSMASPPLLDQSAGVIKQTRTVLILVICVGLAVLVAFSVLIILILKRKKKRDALYREFQLVNRDPNYDKAVQSECDVL